VSTSVRQVDHGFVVLSAGSSGLLIHTAVGSLGMAGLADEPIGVGGVGGSEHVRLGGWRVAGLPAALVDLACGP